MGAFLCVAMALVSDPVGLLDSWTLNGSRDLDELIVLCIKLQHFLNQTL